jgi:hypothetical protein
MYDSLDEQYRYCVHCSADCWPEPANQKHAMDCPTSTGIYPMDAQEKEYGMICDQCDKDIEDYYGYIDMNTGNPVTRAGAGDIVECVCLGCIAAISILGVSYES